MASESVPNDSHTDPDVDVDQGNEEDLMAQAMGFSSFGSQHPNKKRRYNPRADAGGFSLPPKPAMTGANSTSLGTGPSKASNSDEIDLDDCDEVITSSISTQVRPASLPQRPAVVPGTSNAVHQPPFQLRRPQDPPSRDNWYEGYYDSKSNENPWERIEKAQGLSSVGSWLPRSGGPASQAPPVNTE